MIFVVVFVVQRKNQLIMFFECLPALQIWALSKIPSAMDIFPTSSMFTNMDYLFWRLPEEYDISNFPWIL